MERQNFCGYTKMRNMRNFMFLTSVALLTFPLFNNAVCTENNPTVVQNVKNYMEIEFGDTKDSSPIYVYVSPSCLHCSKFLLEDLEKFLKKFGAVCKVVVRFLPISAKDLFILKLIQSKSKDSNEFYLIFTNYMKRSIATIGSVKPSAEQKEKYIGSKKDPEMIKYQVIAKEFGFTDEEIVNAYPDIEGDIEKSMMNTYSGFSEQITDVLESKDITLPLLIRDNKKIDSLPKEP